MEQFQPLARPPQSRAQSKDSKQQAQTRYTHTTTLARPLNGRGGSGGTYGLGLADEEGEGIVGAAGGAGAGGGNSRRSSLFSAFRSEARREAKAEKRRGRLRGVFALLGLMGEGWGLGGDELGDGEEMVALVV